MWFSRKVQTSYWLYFSQSPCSLRRKLKPGDGDRQPLKWSPLTLDTGGHPLISLLPILLELFYVSIEQSMLSKVTEYLETSTWNMFFLYGSQTEQSTEAFTLRTLGLLLTDRQTHGRHQPLVWVKPLSIPALASNSTSTSWQTPSIFTYLAHRNHGKF